MKLLVGSRGYLFLACLKLRFLEAMTFNLLFSFPVLWSFFDIDSFHYLFPISTSHLTSLFPYKMSTSFVCVQLLQLKIQFLVYSLLLYLLALFSNSLRQQHFLLFHWFMTYGFHPLSKQVSHLLISEILILQYSLLMIKCSVYVFPIIEHVPTIIPIRFFYFLLV